MWVELAMDVGEGGGTVTVEYEMQCRHDGSENLVMQVGNGTQTSICAEHTRRREEAADPLARRSRKNRRGAHGIATILPAAASQEEEDGKRTKRKGKRSLAVLEVGPGQHTLVLQWTKHLPEETELTSKDEASARVWSIRVEGVRHGGAFQCTPCPKGPLPSSSPCFTIASATSYRHHHRHRYRHYNHHHHHCSHHHHSHHDSPFLVPRCWCRVGQGTMRKPRVRGVCRARWDSHRRRVRRSASSAPAMPLRPTLAPRSAPSVAPTPSPRR